MLRCRKFEEEGQVRYMRGDFIGPYHSCVGQEATHIGAAATLRPDDGLTCTHHTHGQLIGKGAALPGLAAEIWGKVTGFAKGKGGSMHVADVSVGCIGTSALLGGSMPIALGGALAHKLDRSDRVVMSMFGDGAVNEGIFHETLNWAAAWKLPVIFLCENNQYSVTEWFRDTMAGDFISKRALAYEMPGVTVDGQNVLEVYHNCAEAVARARSGGGPTLIECMTYRYQEHSLRMLLPQDRTGSLPSGSEYRSQWEVEQWRLRDPLKMLETWADQLMDAKRIAGIAEEEEAAVAEAWRFAERSPWPSEDELWLDTWSDPVPDEQRVVLT